MASFSSQENQKCCQPCFVKGQCGQRPGDMPRISHDIHGWGGKGSGSIFFRWHNRKIAVAFLTEYCVFTLLALSHSAQIVIKALRAWHLGHPPHDFCVVPYKGRGQWPRLGPDLQFLKRSVLKCQFWEPWFFVPLLPARDTSPPAKDNNPCRKISKVIGLRLQP